MASLLTTWYLAQTFLSHTVLPSNIRLTIPGGRAQHHSSLPYPPSFEFACHSGYKQLKALLHLAIFLVNYLAILLRQHALKWTCLAMFFLAATVARSRSWFYFVQQWMQQKHFEACSFQSMLHYATIHGTCVATAQRDCDTSCKENCPV